MKPTRKNRFRKNREVRRAPFRDRAVFTAKALLGVLALVAVSGAFILVYDYFTQTRHFQARHIVVTGQQRMNRRQVLKIAGVGPQTNILSVNLTTTRKRLLADPWIADVAVSREIPSGLRIYIQEEEPLAMLDMGDGHGFLINIAGEVFKREDGSDSNALPRVQGLNHADLPVPGKPATMAFQAVMTLFRLAGKKNSPLPLSGIRRIRVDREIGATVYIGEENRAVKFGFGRYREKCEALGHLMVRLSRDNRLTRYRSIDLFDVNRIVITLATAGPSGSDREEV
ncbi:MAG: FtsQ-type POTRA domain-containing protein [Desulfosarcina sp.]|nr:FtsQ-type POTRA domain-containing protein [Desulfosarcina sp.]MBC2742908.1 FtsQ-type POTRA domain-containing protein [Desulfosarcina sp.]MBC2765818.1 FtsQ-type POTRA domain-containing protein [Desulfosarcina sp.]